MLFGVGYFLVHRVVRFVSSDLCLKSRGCNKCDVIQIWCLELCKLASHLLQARSDTRQMEQAASVLALDFDGTFSL